MQCIVQVINGLEGMTHRHKVQAFTGALHGAALVAAKDEALASTTTGIDNADNQALPGQGQDGCEIKSSSLAVVIVASMPTADTANLLPFPI